MKEIKINGIDEVIYYDICDNGMPIYMWVNNKINNFYMTLNVKYGSVHTEFKLDGDNEYTKVNDGIAHFLEHVNFNIDDEKTAHELFEPLGSNINAFTTFDFTAYEVFASSNFETNLNYLLDYVQKPYFTEKLVEKEKGIICEEVKMGKNRPGHKMYYGMNKALFKKDKRRVLVTGEEKDVKKISAQELQLVFDNFYHPMNMFMVITGNFDPEEAVKVIKRNQDSKKFPKYRNPIIKSVKEPIEVNKEYDVITCNVEIPKVKISYKMDRNIFEDIDTMELNVYLGAILRNNFGNTSLFREELLESGLVTGIGASRVVDKNLVIIDVNCETKEPDKIFKLIKNKMKSLEITEEDLKRRRRANVAALINDCDDIEYINSDIADQLINYNKIYNDIYDIYQNTNIDRAKDIISKLQLDNYSVVILEPIKKDSK